MTYKENEIKSLNLKPVTMIDPVMEWSKKYNMMIKVQYQ